MSSLEEGVMRTSEGIKINPEASRTNEDLGRPYDQTRRRRDEHDSKQSRTEEE